MDPNKESAAMTDEIDVFVEEEPKPDSQPEKDDGGNDPITEEEED